MTPEERIALRSQRDGGATPTSTPAPASPSARAAIPPQRDWWQNLLVVPQAIASGVEGAANEAVDGLGALLEHQAGAGARRQAHRTQMRAAEDANGAPSEFVTNARGVMDTIARHDPTHTVPAAMASAFRRWGIISDDGRGDFNPEGSRLVPTPDTPVGHLTEGVSRFVAGYVTLGRVLGPARGNTAAINAGPIQIIGEGWGAAATRLATRSTLQGAAVDLTVWDAQEARLSNLLRDHAGLRDPVTAYLAASADDSELEGRVKAAIEGVGLGVAMESLFLGVRAVREWRRVREGQAGATEATVADAAREAFLAAERDAARVQVQARGAARQYRVQEVNANTEAELRRLDSVVYGDGAPADMRAALSITADSQEVMAIANGADPTALSPRQQQVMDYYRSEQTRIEAKRASALRVEELRTLSETSGDAPDILRLVSEINTERAAAAASRPTYAPASAAADGSTKAGPMRPSVEPLPPIRVFLPSGGEAQVISPELIMGQHGAHHSPRDFLARIDGDGNIRLMPPGPQRAAAATPQSRITARLAATEGTFEATTARLNELRALKANTSGSQLTPTQAEELGRLEAASLAMRSAAFTPSTQTVSIIPDHPVDAADFLRAAHDTAERLRTEAATRGHKAAAAKHKLQEADRLDALVDELDEAMANDGGSGGDINEIAARIYTHLQGDDAALAAIFKKRDPNEAINAEIGQSTDEAIQRALGKRRPQSTLIDADYVKRMNENYAGADDVASASTQQLMRAWRDGDPVVHAANVNLANIDSSDQVLAFIAEHVKLSEASIRTVRGETLGEARIGVQTQEQTQAIGRAVARDAGTDMPTLIARLAEITGSTDNLAAKLHAVRVLHVTAADESQRAMRVFNKTNSDEDLSRALNSMQAFATIHSALKGVSSETARALASLRASVSADRSLIEQFQQLVDDSIVRGLDPTGGTGNALEALQRLGSRLERATSRRGMSRVFEPRLGRAIEDLYTASILSSPSTHVLNMVGNAFTTVATPIERMLAGAAIYAKSGFRDAAIMAEAVDHTVGIFATANEASRLAFKAFRENTTFLDSTFSADFHSNFRAESFGVNPDNFFGRGLNAFGKIIGVVNRFMGAQDEFWKQMNYRAYLYAQAMRDGRQAGLRGPALATHVDEFVTAGFTGEGRSVRAGVSPAEMDLRNNAYDRALRLTRRNTFTEPPGQVLGAIEKAIRMIPLGRLVVPFYRTPISIVKYWARRSGVAVPTPWGAKGVGTSSFLDDIEGRNGKHVQEEAVGQVMLGNVIYAASITSALAGGITGSGPSDPNEREALMRSGWRPYSFKIGDRYIPYNRADPFGLFFSVVADATDMANETFEGRPDDPGELGMLLVANMAQMLRDKSFFVGIDTILSAIQNDTQSVEIDHVEKVIVQYSGAMVPFSGALGRMFDDGYVHRPRTIMDAVMMKSPFRSGVEYRRNWLGERVRSDQPLLGHALLSPIGTTRAITAEEDPVLNAIARVAFESQGGMGPVARRQNGVDLTEFNSPVSGRNAFDRLQELMAETKVGGRTLREELTRIVTSPTWDRMTSGSVSEDGLEARGSRQDAFTRTRTRYRNAAERELRREIPELHEAMQKAEALQRGRRRPNAANRERPFPAGLEWLQGD